MLGELDKVPVESVRQAGNGLFHLFLCRAAQALVRFAQRLVGGALGPLVDDAEQGACRLGWIGAQGGAHREPSGLTLLQNGLEARNGAIQQVMDRILEESGSSSGHQAEGGLERDPAQTLLRRNFVLHDLSQVADQGTALLLIAQDGPEFDCHGSAVTRTRSVGPVIDGTEGGAALFAHLGVTIHNIGESR